MQTAHAPPRRALRLVAWVLMLISVGALALIFSQKHRPKPLSSAEPTEPEQIVVKRTATAVRPAAAEDLAGGRAPRPEKRSASVPYPEVSQETRELVKGLVNLDSRDGVMDAQQAAAWKQRFRMLVDQGQAGVPAIGEFLAQNSDLDFGASGKQALGYRSARTALIDALGQIGGPPAVGALMEVLGTTADPLEIALLTQNLEKLEPGLHQPAALDAARQALAMAAAGNLPDRDVGPLFEVLGRYGGAAAATELVQNASQWNYYSMIALAQLPENSGIPVLEQVAASQAGGGSGAQIAAVQLLAQLAAQSDDARAFLVSQAKQGGFSAYLWAALAPILAGDRMGFQNSAFDNTLSAASPSDVRMTHLANGNQNYFAAGGPMTADLAQQQTALIDALQAVTGDPQGLLALQQARTLLAQRTAQLAPGHP